MQQPARIFYHLALTGFPLGHSLSPIIHSSALRACGLEGEYILRPIPPETAQEDLALIVAALRQGGLHGLNVTIPHKQSILPMCDDLTPAARAIGAVNLLYVQDSRVIGDNSDAPGFLAGLAPFRHLMDASGQPLALVLGAGGSARAVIFALASSGWKVTVMTRRLNQAIDLIASFSPYLPRNSLETAEYKDHGYLSGAKVDLLVNTTPVGMHPKPEASPWPDTLPLPSHAIIYDLVYNPRQTLLLKRAAEQGLTTIGGLTMLVEQAAVSFERWTGQTAPRAVMFQSVESN